MENYFLNRLKSAIEKATYLLFSQITDKNKTRACVYPRMIFAKIATERNFSTAEITKILNVDRISVFYYLKKYPSFMSFPDFKKLDMDIRFHLINLSVNQFDEARKIYLDSHTESGHSRIDMGDGWDAAIGFISDNFLIQAK
jgi:predicted transcriptional regulator